MPLVRISHLSAKPAGFSKTVSQAVHTALIAAFGIPADDLFQIITEHVAGDGLIGPESFLGIDHSKDLVFVQITCAEGRSVEQKKALYAAIVENIARETPIRREDVIINLIETKRENWSFGNGIAPFAA
ncbi:MAG: 4-oxalocrotonate [Beijerinckiaceae bacterium]|nr:MAG: 4-oxalocrotonate [Beijerinckiaceae bacterium]